MKQILLMRHAKSSWEDSGLKDFDRPLANRGLHDAPMMGEFIRKAGVKPGMVISSTAERARQTTELSADTARLGEGKITWNEQLYYGGVNDYIKAIQGASDDSERIMLVGHNPLMETTAGILAGAETKVAVRMPTAALVCLQSFAESWNFITPGSCQIKWMMIPKVLKGILG